MGELCACKCDQGWSGPNCRTGDADAIREADNLIDDIPETPQKHHHHHHRSRRPQTLTVVLSYILMFLSLFALGYIVYVCISLGRRIRKDEEEVAVNEDEDVVDWDDEENNEGISGIIKAPAPETIV